MESKHIHIVVTVLTNIARFLLAGVFLFSGFIKANDSMGTVYKLQEYFEAWHLPLAFGGWPAYILAWTMGIVEFMLGIYMLFGIRKKLGALLILLLMCVMTPLTLWLAVSNPISDCGCFGDALVLSNWATFQKNVVLLVAAWMVYRYNDRIFRLVTERFDWLIGLYSFVYVVFFIYYTLHYLPVFDFRPYHVDANIPKGMEIPEGKQPTVYETRFIYERNGIRKEFGLENYPGNDSTWIFVDSKTVVKEKGYEPPIHDFSIVDTDGNDLTDEILNDKRYTFLLIAPWLSRADDSGMDRINAIYDWAQERNYRFICLTASTEEEIKGWQDNTGAEYPFAMTDATTLKTMVRANPGMILLCGGTIVNKWSSNMLPDEPELRMLLDKDTLKKNSVKTFRRKMADVILLFIIPLAMFTMLDWIWLTWKKRKRTN